MAGERLGGSLELPKFQGTTGEIATFKREIGIAGNRRALEKGPIIAHLPTVIGSVPPQERPFFDSAAGIKGTALRREISADIIFRKDPKHSQMLHESLPVTMGLVQDYLDAMDLGLKTESCFVETKTTRAGQVPLIKEWHIDETVFFLINNIYGTEFNHGAFRVNSNGITLLDNNPPIAAKPYEIVPISPLTLHRSPVFPRDAVRTRMALFTKE